MINIRLASYVMANNVYIYANFLFLYCVKGWGGDYCFTNSTIPKSTPFNFK